jgi:hypothetical protein
MHKMKVRKHKKHLEETYGSSHVGIVDCPILEAYLLFINREFDLAEKNCQTALTQLGLALSLDHPWRFETMWIIAMVYHGQGPLTDALRRYCEFRS